MSTYVHESPVTPEDLRLLGEDVLAAFLVDGPSGVVRHETTDGRLRASVSVRGEWDGWITLEVSAAAAHDLTSRMLHTDDVTDEDVRDAVGELVNVLGGNVKSLLVEGSVLGLPEVTDADLPVEHHVEICQTELWWADHPVHVRVWAADPDQHTRSTP